jgi:hypothetical protein
MLYVDVRAVWNQCQRVFIVWLFPAVLLMYFIYVRSSLAVYPGLHDFVRGEKKRR